MIKSIIHIEINKNRRNNIKWEFFEYLGQEIHRIPVIREQYCLKKITFLDKLIEKLSIKLLMGTLQKLNQNGNKSSELLCFGYHVIARK